MGWTWEMVGHLYWFFVLRTTDCCLQNLRNTVDICLVKCWLHSGRSVSNSTLQKQRLWQLRRNHRRHWRPALVWRSQCWTSRRPINGWVICCRRKMQAQDRTILTTDYKVRPVHSMFTNRFSVTSRLWFFDAMITSVVRFQLGPTNDLRKLDVHCRKLLRRAVGPPADIDWNQPWHTIRHVWHRRIDQQLEYHGVKMWSRKYLDEYCKFANYVTLLDDNRWRKTIFVALCSNLPPTSMPSTNNDEHHQTTLPSLPSSCTRPPRVRTAN